MQVIAFERYTPLRQRWLSGGCRLEWGVLIRFLMFLYSSLKSYVYKCMNSLTETETFLIISNFSFYRNSAFFCWIFFPDK